jgi:hypothetical protein
VTLRFRIVDTPSIASARELSFHIEDSDWCIHGKFRTKNLFSGWFSAPSATAPWRTTTSRPSVSSHGGTASTSDSSQYSN